MRIHHSAICVRDLDASLRFWRDGLGFALLMDEGFDGDLPTLLHAPTDHLRSVFLGDPAHADAGIVELVDLGPLPEGVDAADPTVGFLLLSVLAPVEATLARLAGLGLGGEPRRTTASGVAMAVVVDPDGVLVELIDDIAGANLDDLVAGGPA